MKSILIKCVLSAYLAVLLLAAPRLSAQDKVELKPASVPFEMLKTQHMAVQVMINGKGPYRLIFDTGAPVTLITNKVAKEAGVFPEKFKGAPFAFFGSQGQFKIKTLEMGELKVDNVDTMVMDHPTVAIIAKALGPIEGIVGFNVFGKHRTTIDYQTKTMTFVPNSYKPVDMMTRMLTLIMAPRSERERAKVLAPGGLVGMRVEKEAGDEEDGVAVVEVFEGSAAASAGLKSGDRLLKLDGRWTDSVADCYFAASRLQAGSRVVADILRDGKPQRLELQIRAGI
jgi:hypothetical protein